MDDEMICPGCGARKKHRTEEEKRSLIKRLKLAEGQIRGIQKMIDNDAYCSDVLIQVSAVSNALNSFNRELLSTHIKSCVAEDIKRGDEGALDDFIRMLRKIMK